MGKLEKYIRSIPDFPKEGIIFRDVTSLLQDAEGFHLAVEGLVKSLENVDFDVVVAPESRGFIFGTPVAYELQKSFVPVRKKGKLPCETISHEYSLEYGTATLELHKDAIKPGDKVVIVDDLLATGGTTEAMIHLVEQLGGSVEKCVFVIELIDLKGRDLLSDRDVDSLVVYQGE
jgi:adenine phosphoribosyltransferase